MSENEKTTAEAVTPVPEEGASAEAVTAAVEDVTAAVPAAAEVETLTREEIIDLGKKILKICTYAAAAAVFIYTAAVIIWYIFVGYKPEFHADCTDTIMWANASYESGSLYDPTFKYACFLPFGVNLIMYPLICIFGLTMKAHVLGMFGFFVLITGFMLLMFREMHWGIRGSLLGTSLFLAMTVSTDKLRELFWQHTIYYTLGLLFIVIGLFLYMRTQNLTEKRALLSPDDKKRKSTSVHLVITYAALAIFIMLTATDGISALSIFALPFMVAVFAEFFVCGDNKLLSKPALRVMLTVLGTGIMILAGTKLNNFLIGDLKANYQDANSEFSTMGTWLDHVHMFPTAWLELTGVVDLPDVMFNEKEGMINLVYLASSLIILAIPVLAVFLYPKFRDSKDAVALRLMVWIHWFSSAIVMIGYICGILSAAAWRLTPIYGTSLLVAVFLIHWAVTSKTSQGRFILLIAIPLVVTSYINLSSVRELPKDYKKENPLYGVAEYLEDNDLTYGYATFWNANSITLLSDSKVKVRDVYIDNNGFRKRHYQSSSEWYKDQPGQDRYFLLMSYYEYAVLQNNDQFIVDRASEDRIVYINDCEYHLLVFDRNLF